MNNTDIELKDRWNFHVGFEFPPELQQHAKPIELMVSGVDIGAENLNMTPNLDGTLHHRSGRVIFWLYDDEAGAMMKAIRALQREQPVFSMRIGFCGELGFPELEEYIYTGCRLEALQHSLLSYSPDYDTIKLKAYEPASLATDEEGYAHPPVQGKVELAGRINNSNNKRTVMKLLQVTFEAVSHVFLPQYD
jgi:hypothetical protein